MMISTSSLVIAACRPRLYFICSDPIMSCAFFDALSIAVRLQGVSILIMVGQEWRRTGRFARTHGSRRGRQRQRWRHRSSRRVANRME